MEKSYHIKDLLLPDSPEESVEINATEAVNENEVAESEPDMTFDDNTNDVIPVEVASSTIQVDFVDVDALIINDIRDLRGRISDLIDVIEEKTGNSVIPFEVANIAPEIVKLQRHDIFHIDDKCYAMDRVPRNDVVESYTERIIKTISSGLPFIESLQTKMEYGGVLYNTYALSQAEWTIILSKFRRYRQELKIQNGSNIVMSIYAERVK